MIYPLWENDVVFFFTSNIGLERIDVSRLFYIDLYYCHSDTPTLVPKQGFVLDLCQFRRPKTSNIPRFIIIVRQLSKCVQKNHQYLHVSYIVGYMLLVILPRYPEQKIYNEHDTVGGGDNCLHSFSRYPCQIDVSGCGKPKAINHPQYHKDSQGHKVHMSSKIIPKW